MLSRATGWVNNERSRAWLRANQKRFDRSHFMAYRVPAEVNNIGKAPILDQGDVGRCTGYSDETLFGLLNLRFAGAYVATSGDFNYVTNQMIGLGGAMPTADTGATIADAAEARQKYGSCAAALKPATPAYDPTVTPEAFADGAKHTESSHSVLTTPSQILQYIGTIGYVQYGIPVGDRFQNCTGILTLADVVADCRNPEGGHALAGTGFLLPETVAAYGFSGLRSGRYFLIPNSWGKSYGYHGYLFVEWEAVAYWCQLINHGDVEIIGKSHPATFDNTSPPQHIDVSNIYAAYRPAA